MLSELHNNLDILVKTSSSVKEVVFVGFILIDYWLVYIVIYYYLFHLTQVPEFMALE